MGLLEDDLPPVLRGISEKTTAGTKLWGRGEGFHKVPTVVARTG